MLTTLPDVQKEVILNLYVNSYVSLDELDIKVEPRTINSLHKRGYVLKSIEIFRSKKIETWKLSETGTDLYVELTKEINK